MTRRSKVRRRASRSSSRQVEAGAAVIMVAGAFAIVGILLNAGFTFNYSVSDQNIRGLATAYEVELAAEAYSQSTGMIFTEQALQCLKEKCSNEESASNCVQNYAEFCSL